MSAIELIAKILLVTICGLILLISIISHVSIKRDSSNIAMAKEMFRRQYSLTLGNRVYFYCLMLFCVSGFWHGGKDITFYFCLSAVLSERLIVYRICRANKDWLGRFLTKIGW